MMIATATQLTGQGPPATLEILHSARSIDFDEGEIEFENGKRVRADLIIGADGVVVSVAFSPSLSSPVRCANPG
jgi:2-polyprenyl-6-methoxyphenol hydroxylase-like FAD-dependent oxidoreductase